MNQWEPRFDGPRGASAAADGAEDDRAAEGQAVDLECVAAGLADAHVGGPVARPFGEAEFRPRDPAALEAQSVGVVEPDAAHEYRSVVARPYEPEHLLDAPERRV